MFELYYSNGGHGGPYRTILDAKLEALRRLAGNQNEQFIRIVGRNTGVVYIVTRTHLDYIDRIK